MLPGSMPRSPSLPALVLPDSILGELAEEVAEACLLMRSWEEADAARNTLPCSWEEADMAADSLPQPQQRQRQHPLAAGLDCGDYLFERIMGETACSLLPPGGGSFYEASRCAPPPPPLASIPSFPAGKASPPAPPPLLHSSAGGSLDGVLPVQLDDVVLRVQVGTEPLRRSGPFRLLPSEVGSLPAPLPGTTAGAAMPCRAAAGKLPLPSSGTQAVSALSWPCICTVEALRSVTDLQVCLNCGGGVGVICMPSAGECERPCDLQAGCGCDLLQGIRFISFKSKWVPPSHPQGRPAVRTLGMAPRMSLGGSGGGGLGGPGGSRGGGNGGGGGKAGGGGGPAQRPGFSFQSWQSEDVIMQRWCTKRG